MAWGVDGSAVVDTLKCASRNATLAYLRGHCELGPVLAGVPHLVVGFDMVTSGLVLA